MTVYTACREAVQAVVNGADINARCTGQPATDLIQDTNNLVGGANAEPPTSTGNLTAAIGPTLLDLASRHGISTEASDAHLLCSTSIIAIWCMRCSSVRATIATLIDITVGICDH